MFNRIDRRFKCLNVVIKNVIVGTVVLVGQNVNVTMIANVQKVIAHVKIVNAVHAIANT